MFTLTLPLYLCSKSPRRSKLLRDAKIPFEVCSIDTDESFPLELPIEKIPIFISHKKWLAAKSIVDDPHSIILTADTMVFLDQKPLGKPKDREEALYFLESLSNRTHQVVTGFSLGVTHEGNPIVSRSIVSHVTFKALSNEDMVNYINTGSPFDKAGGYGFQDDFGANFVSQIEGPESNVIGLPVETVISELIAHNWLKKA